MKNSGLSRRDFMKFIGVTSTALGGLSCSKVLTPQGELLPFKPLAPNYNDDLTLAKGFEYKVLIKWEDQISTEDKFGFNNDYTAFIPMNDKKDEAFLWVNHEAVDVKFVSGSKNGFPKTKSQVDKEMYNVGGSILHIKKENQRWIVIKDSKYNRRISGLTPIDFAGNIEVKGSRTALGTLGNCAGGVTPWNTILTCEENFQFFYGDRQHKEENLSESSTLGWEKYYNNPPEHYGWVVEIDPYTGKSKKHTSIGRYAHECATVTRAKDGRIVVYSGDDKKNEFIYKFISNSSVSIEEGELFVADLVNGKWISLDINKNSLLKKEFKNQLDVLTYCRKAGKIVGATPCDRPEDFAINEANNDVLICLTNNYDYKDLQNPKNNFYGSILKVKELNADAGSLSFSSETFLSGGDETDVACPDNITFDRSGNLWMTNDISGSFIGKGPFKNHGNNSLFYIPMKGKDAGKAFRVAIGPVNSELTGITFSPDGRTLFLSVQHPGEKSKDLSDLTSNWPDGGTTLPRPAVVQIYGDALSKLTTTGKMAIA